MYGDEEMLMLSGIQHYMFCPRQWGLIHVEQLWKDNRLTTEGSLLHERVDNPFYREKNAGKITLRRVALASRRIGLYGFADAIELHKSDSEKNAIKVRHYPGYWLPYPIEYKHGRHKKDACDEVQLVAQVMCLEEMYGIELHKAALFYWETEQREQIIIGKELRSLVVDISISMHKIMDEGILPPAEYTRQCRSCSLREICVPEASDKKAGNYLRQYLYEKNA